MFSPHYVALTVSDLDRSVSFYEQFGFEKVHEYVADDKSLAIVHTKLDTFVLELFTFAEVSDLPESAADIEIDLPIVGTKHFSFGVVDARAAYEWCQQKGIEIAKEIKMGRMGTEYFFIKDPDGIWVEIIEKSRKY